METWVIFLFFSPVYIPLVISLALFFNSEKKNHAKRTLSLVLLNIAFLFYGLYFFLSGKYEFYAKILPYNVMSLLLIYPSIYIYIRQLIQPHYPVKKILIHLLPACITMLESLVYFFMLDAQGRVQFVTVFRFNPIWTDPVLVFLYFWRVINILILFFQIFYYGFKIIFILRKYSSTILDIFSYTEGISLNSIKILNFVLFVGSVASIGFYSINPVKVFGNYVVLIIPLAVISVAIWSLGIVGMRQKMLPVEIEPESQPAETKEELPLKILYKNLIIYFAKEKPYLNSELKIDDLILVLGTNRTHLSNAINQFSGKNFNRFVNDYRIEFAKEYISKNHPDCTKEEVAEAAGFGSVRSFERNFSDSLGVTFGQFVVS